MKFIIEYGVKRGQHCDNVILSMPISQAVKMFATLALSFQTKRINDEFSPKTLDFLFRNRDQVTWNNETHFICFTRYSWAIDNQPGPGSAKFWNTKGHIV